MPVPFSIHDQVAALCEPDTDPILTADEIDAAITRTIGAQIWAPNTTYAIGSIVVPTVPNGWTYQVSASGSGWASSSWDDPYWFGGSASGTPGVSGATEPLWNVPYSPRNPTARVQDNTILWVAHTPDMGGPYAAKRAAAECLRIKARKCLNRVDSTIAGGVGARESQMYQMMMDQADRLEPVALF